MNYRRMKAEKKGIACWCFWYWNCIDQLYATFKLGPLIFCFQKNLTFFIILK